LSDIDLLWFTLSLKDFDMNRSFAAFLLVISTFAITGCDSGGDVVPDEAGGIPTMTADEQAALDAYSKSQAETPQP